MLRGVPPVVPTEPALLSPSPKRTDAPGSRWLTAILRTGRVQHNIGKPVSPGDLHLLQPPCLPENSHAKVHIPLWVKGNDAHPCTFYRAVCFPSLSVCLCWGLRYWSALSARAPPRRPKRVSLHKELLSMSFCSFSKGSVRTPLRAGPCRFSVSL